MGGEGTPVASAAFVADITKEEGIMRAYILLLALISLPGCVSDDETDKAAQGNNSPTNAVVGSGRDPGPGEMNTAVESRDPGQPGSRGLKSVGSGSGSGGTAPGPR